MAKRRKLTKDLLNFEKRLTEFAKGASMGELAEALLQHPVHGPLLRAFAAEEAAPEHANFLERLQSIPDRRARSIMKTQVITVKPSTPITKVARLLVRHKVGEVPVVDERNKTKVIGVVSETDLLAAPANAKTVAEVMRKQFISVTPDTPIDQIVRMLAKRKMGSVPVIDAGRLVGIINRIDVLRARYGG